jgi:hypothetical protein
VTHVRALPPDKNGCSALTHCARWAELEELAAAAGSLKTQVEKKEAQLARSDKIIEKLRKDIAAFEQR